ncbi:Alpha-actinin-like protein 1 [Zancudomyces culisetae]|uniref:Alpha-actinin-like protein 1 n=1 Tax=Zancudomyces culisetae TaxID=1213189 RepID=A0A1R1PPG4_ZANCU|nr:Alpha-actinin-like protein 1 [Zancudomyces culisetae]|eukprot:OMH82831.1 Alpha-actinin-like protein 1 [Zancudomyces culisetae]
MAKRRIDKFTNTVQIANAMKRDYMDRARRLIEKIQLLQAEFECTKTKSRQLNDVTELITSFEEYCKHGRKQIVAEKLELNGLAGDIITKLMAYQSNRNLEADIITASEQIETEWKRLCQQETTYNTALNAAVIELKDKASREIGQFANQIYESIIRIHNEISEITCYGGDNNETEVEALDQQGDQLSKLILVVESFEKELEQLQAMESECRQMQIDCTVYTIHSSQSIVADLELIKQTLLKKKSYLVNQTLLRNVSNITPAQLDEFESVFYHFDKGDCNSLNAAEFRAALEALDLAYSESEFTEIFEFLAQGNDAQRISFEKYIRFLVAVFEDKDDYAQLFESFHTVASGKPYVSITDLKAAGLSEASISKLACDMPKYEGDDLLLDYVSYIKSLN